MKWKISGEQIAVTAIAAYIVFETEKIYGCEYFTNQNKIL